MNAPQKILIVEDDVALAHAISINLKARSYEVHTANTASLALRIAGEWSPDLIRNHGSLVSKLDLLHAVWEKTTTGKPTTCGCTCSNCGRNWRPTPKPTALHHLPKRWLPIRAVEAFRRDRAR